MTTKAAQAAELFAQNPNMTSKQLADLFVEKLGMTPLGARTYSYNVRKAGSAPKVEKTVAKKVAAPKEPKVKGVAKKQAAQPTGTMIANIPWDELSDVVKQELAAEFKVEKVQ